MPDIHELLFHLVGGLIALAVLNLLLEVLGISLLGGDRKPNFLLRLILVPLVGFGIGYGVHTYVMDEDHHMMIHHMVHVDDANIEVEIVGDDNGCSVGEEIGSPENSEEAGSE